MNKECLGQSSKQTSKGEEETKGQMGMTDTGGRMQLEKDQAGESPRTDPGWPTPPPPCLRRSGVERESYSKLCFLLSMQFFLFGGGGGECVCVWDKVQKLYWGEILKKFLIQVKLMYTHISFRCTTLQLDISIPGKMSHFSFSPNASSFGKFSNFT